MFLVRFVQPFRGGKAPVSEGFEQHLVRVLCGTSALLLQSGWIEVVGSDEQRPLPADHERLDRWQVAQGHFDRERLILFVPGEGHQTVRIPRKDSAAADAVDRFLSRRIALGEMPG